jgi:hypothetical protein
MKNYYGEKSIDLDSISYEDILREAMSGDSKANSCVIAMPSENGLSVLCSINANSEEESLTVTLTKEGKALYQNAFGKNVIAGQSFNVAYDEMPADKFAKIIGVGDPVSDNHSFAEVIEMSKKNNSYGLIVGNDMNDLQYNSKFLDIPVSEVATREKVFTGGEKYSMSMDGKSLDVIKSKSVNGNELNTGVIGSVQTLSLENTALTVMGRHGLNVMPSVLKLTSGGATVLSKELNGSVEIKGSGSDYYQCSRNFEQKQDLSIPVGVMASFVTGNFSGNIDEPIFLSKFALRLSESQKENYFSGLIFQKMIGCSRPEDSGQNLKIKVTENGVKASLPAFDVPEMSLIKDPSTANRIHLGVNGVDLNAMTHEQACALDPVISALYKHDKELFASAFSKAESIRSSFYSLAQMLVIKKSELDKLVGVLGGDVMNENQLRNVAAENEVKAELPERKAKRDMSGYEM